MFLSPLRGIGGSACGGKFVDTLGAAARNKFPIGYKIHHE